MNQAKRFGKRRLHSRGTAKTIEPAANAATSQTSARSGFRSSGVRPPISAAAGSSLTLIPPAYTPRGCPGIRRGADAGAGSSRWRRRGLGTDHREVTMVPVHAGGKPRLGEPVQLLIERAGGVLDPIDRGDDVGGIGGDDEVGEDEPSAGGQDLGDAGEQIGLARPV